MEPGALIAGRYRIERPIATGGQASVFLARQEPLDRRVALKLLVPSPDATPKERQTFQRRFLREAKTLATLDHPNIVVIHDYGEVEGEDAYYIAMEYIEGVRFNDLLRRGPLEQGRALRLVGQVCSALRYAHQRGVIHRDIKHSNVMVRRGHDGSEQIKVVDFGIAKMMEDEGGITMTGVVLGSAHFMAPEQARGQPLDQRVDIYAVGVLLYCSLVGRYPFDGASFREIIFAHLGQEMPPFRAANPGLSPVAPALEDAVRRCLAKEPADRFADVDTLLNALSPFREDGPSQETDPVTPAAPAAPVRARTAAPAPDRWWLLPLVIGLLAFALSTAILVVIVVVALVIWMR